MSVDCLTFPGLTNFACKALLLLVNKTDALTSRYHKAPSNQRVIVTNYDVLARSKPLKTFERREK